MERGRHDARWVGLTVGMLLVVMGLTGSVITYEQELDAWLHPELFTAPSEGAPVPLDRTIAIVRASLPQGATLEGARWPHEPGRAISWFYRASDGMPWELTSDPHSGRVLGQRRSDTHVLAWIYELHATLCAGVTGNIVLAVLAFATLWLVGAGLWLWWPRTGRWKQALRIKRGVGRARLHFDLHRVTGAYAAPLLLVIAFTGIYMAWPPVMNAMVSWFTPVTELGLVRGSGEPLRIAPEAAVAEAQRHFPGTRLKVLVLPQGPRGVYEISLYRPGDRLLRKSGEWMAWIDPATGRALRLSSPLTGTPGDRFIAWLFPLHNGEVFGEASRAVVCLLGLIPLVLGVTGLSIWWRRRSHVRKGVFVHRPEVRVASGEPIPVFQRASR